MKRREVSRLGRKLDRVSLIFVAAGALLFVVAFSGMRELRDQRGLAFERGRLEAYAALNRYFRLQRLSYLGLTLGAAGIAIGLSAAVRERKISKGRSADSSLRSE